jgi:hypothetical protein
MVNQRIKATLSITINPQLYRRLKEEIGDRKVSDFVERAIAKELGERDNKLEREQKEFQQSLVRGYKAMAKNKKLKKELAI